MKKSVRKAACLPTSPDEALWLCVRTARRTCYRLGSGSDMRRAYVLESKLALRLSVRLASRNFLSSPDSLDDEG